MNRRAVGWMALVPAVFLAFFFVYPLVSIVIGSFTLEGRPDLSAFVEIAGRGTLRRAAWFTLWQAVASTALTLLLALPTAYVLARFDLPGRRVILAAVTVPFVLPTVVVGTAFVALLSPQGPLNVDLRQTVWAILAAHVFFNYAVVVRTVSSFWRLVDRRIEEAARTLGATPWQAFRRITLPLLAPSIAAAASIVFLFTFTSFGVVLILGGFSTIEVAIWRQATIHLDLAAAAALAIVQMVGVGVALAFYSRYQVRRAHQLNLSAAKQTIARPASPGQWGVVVVTLGAMMVALGTPLAVLLGRSLRTDTGWSLDHYRSLWRGTARLANPIEPIANSLAYASAATIIASVVGLTAAIFLSRRTSRSAQRLDTLMMLPLGTSAVTLGLGFLVAFDWPIDLRASAWLIPIAHSLVAVPFVIRTTTPVLRSVRARLREAAATLGASPSQVLRHIDMPIVAKAALVGAGFAFAVSLGEFGATAFLVRPDRPTIPTAIFRLLGQPGDATFGQAMALSALLMVLTTVVIGAIDRFRVAGLGEF